MRCTSEQVQAAQQSRTEPRELRESFQLPAHEMPLGSTHSASRTPQWAMTGGFYLCDYGVDRAERAEADLRHPMGNAAGVEGGRHQGVPGEFALEAQRRAVLQEPRMALTASTDSRIRAAGCDHSPPYRLSMCAGLRTQAQPEPAATEQMQIAGARYTGRRGERWRRWSSGRRARRRARSGRRRPRRRAARRTPCAPGPRSPAAAAPPRSANRPAGRALRLARRDCPRERGRCAPRSPGRPAGPRVGSGSA